MSAFVLLHPDNRTLLAATGRSAGNYLAFIKLASIRIWLRAYESTPWLARVVSGCAVIDRPSIFQGSLM